jgi:hypothetical protein
MEDDVLPSSSVAMRVPSPCAPRLVLCVHRVRKQKRLTVRLDFSDCQDIMN